jgi:NADH-quinone oxidoreductase subunit L
MVAAGIYLLIRMFPVLDRANVTGFVAVIGALTALYGGCCAIVQPNLKRVLAYSTVSQLGLMVFAIGMDATAVAAFHLATHAAFKAVLFLAAGSVIHALDGEEMLDAMGGLWVRLPQTGIAFLIGALALGGFPGFSGFFSKDAIVDVAREHGILPYLAALAISALTAAYATRAFVRTFLGPRNPAHIHPPGPVMLIPQWILAILAVIMGYVPIERFLIPSLGGEVVTIDIQTAIISTAVSLLSAAVTWLLVSDPDRRRALLAGGAGLQRFLLYGMGLDALVDALVVRPVTWIAGIAQPDAIASSPGSSVQQGEAEGRLAGALRHPSVHRYVAGLGIGAFALAVYLLVRGW